MEFSPLSGNYQEPVRVKGSAKCPNHVQKDVFYVCLDCKTLMCTTCGIKSHHKLHNLDELTDVVERKTTSMFDFVSNAKNNSLPQLNRDLMSIDNQLDENSTKLKDLCSTMKNQGEKCKQEIDDLISQWTLICQNMERVNMELLLQQKKGKQKRRDVLTQEIEDCQKVLQSGSLVDKYDTGFDTLTDEAASSLPVLQTAEFSPRKFVIPHLTRALGTFTTSIYILLDELTVVTKFGFSELFRSICPTPQGNALAVLEYNNCYVLHINSLGGIDKDIKHDAEIRDVSRCPVTGQIWFCSQQTVYGVHSTSPVAKFNVDREIWSMHITTQGNVVVGTKEMVAVYTSNGSVIHTATRHGTGIRGPMKITGCPVTCNIAAVSWEESGMEEDTSLDRYTMYIIVYDRNLKVSFIYRGSDIDADDTVTPDRFGPGSIVYDSFGNLVVADWKRNTIELVSGSGQYIKTLLRTKGQQGVIGIQSGNVLWSQTDDKEIQLLRYYR